jgi:signal transduction histidine kinase
VYADKEMMEFVLRNLISNAIKFNHRNNVVVVNAFQQNNFIIIEVQDSGIGLTENKIKKLLEMDTTICSRVPKKKRHRFRLIDK